jgi:hypothetical protein
MNNQDKPNIYKDIEKSFHTSIGLPSDMDDSKRPIKGYLVHKSQIEKKRRQIASTGVGNPNSDAIYEMSDKDFVGDGLTAQGEIEIVLKPEVSGRTSYMRGNSLKTGGKPVAMSSNNPDDVLNAIIHDDTQGKKKRMAESVAGLIKASIDNDYSGVASHADADGRLQPVDSDDPSPDRPHESYEAHILGGFKVEDIDGIHYPYSKIEKNAKSIDISDFFNKEMLMKKMSRARIQQDIAQREVGRIGAIDSEIKGNKILRELRLAKEISKKYRSMGIPYVRFAHPLGINIEDPRTYDKSARAYDDPEKIIKSLISAELDQYVAKLAKQQGGQQ